MSQDSSMQRLATVLADAAVDLYGYADVVDLFPGEWAAWPRAISIGLALPAKDLVGVQVGPTSAYYAAYNAANARLNRVAQAVEAWLQHEGYRARAFKATVSAEELGMDLAETLAAPVQHKTVATRAGLGWIGKNALLVTSRYGPRVRLASIFTDMPLDAAVPIAESHCGACDRCVRACPAGAIHGVSWQAGLPRETLVDVWACRRTAERLLWERAGRRDAVCGVCIAVCPWMKVKL